MRVEDVGSIEKEEPSELLRRRLEGFRQSARCLNCEFVPGWSCNE